MVTLSGELVASRPSNDLCITIENMESFWQLIQRMWADGASCRPAAEVQLEDTFASVQNDDVIFLKLWNRAIRPAALN